MSGGGGLSRDKARTLTKEGTAAESTPLWRCLQEEQYGEAEDLIRRKAAGDVQMKDTTFGWTPALWAANSGLTSLLQSLLTGKAKVDSVCKEGNSALALAARSGHDAAVELLITSKASLATQNTNGWNALHWASINGHESVAMTLMEASADVKVIDNRGRNTCMWAARHGHREIVDSILACGINLGVEDHDGMTVMDHAQDQMELRALIAATQEMNDAIIAAAQRHDTDEVRRCIEAGACLDFRDEDGWTPLMWAAMHQDLDLVQLLVRHGANPSLLDENGLEIEELVPEHLAIGEALVAIIGSNQRLCEAARDNDWVSVEREINNGAFFNTMDKTRRTPLMWAAKHGSIEAVTMMQGKGAPLDERDDFGWTSVHHAVDARDPMVISALHYLGADFAVKTFEGDTALHLAVRMNDGALIQLLLASGADIEETDVLDRTPLQLAMSGGFATAVRTLLIYNADPQVVDKNERSCIHLAVLENHANVCDTMFSPLGKPPLIEGKPPSKASSPRNAKSPTSASPRAEEAKPPVSPSSPTSPSSKAGANSKKRASAAAVPKVAAAPKVGASKGKAKAGAKKAPPAGGGAGGVMAARSRFKRTFAEKRGETPDALLLSTTEGRASLIKKAPPKISAKILGMKDKDGLAALQLAVVFRFTDTANLLMSHKADPAVCDAQGNTVLMTATATQQSEVVVQMLGISVNVNAKNSEQKRAIDLATDPYIFELLNKYEILQKLKAEGPSAETKAAEENPKEKKKKKPKSAYRVRLEDLPLDIPKDLLEEAVKNMMRVLGAPRAKIELLVDPITSRPRGFAYVEFADAVAVDLALKGDGGQLSGSIVHVFRET